MNDRIAWDQIWLEMASSIARRSLCVRAQVGCVLVTRDNLIAAATYNGPSPRFEHHNLPCTHWCDRANMKTQDLVNPQSYSNCPSVHAEASALIRADASKISGATLYCSSNVCSDCAKLIAHSGISRVVHVVQPQYAYRKPEAVESYLRDLGIVVERGA